MDTLQKPMSVAWRDQAWHAPKADDVADRKFSAIPGTAMGTHGDTGADTGDTLGQDSRLPEVQCVRK